jgi:hypothetical protein
MSNIIEFKREKKSDFLMSFAVIILSSDSLRKLNYLSDITGEDRLIVMQELINKEYNKRKKKSRE